MKKVNEDDLIITVKKVGPVSRPLKPGCIEVLPTVYKLGKADQAQKMVFEHGWCREVPIKDLIDFLQAAASRGHTIADVWTYEFDLSLEITTSLPEE